LILHRHPMLQRPHPRNPMPIHHPPPCPLGLLSHHKRPIQEPPSATHAAKPPVTMPMRSSAVKLHTALCTLPVAMPSRPSPIEHFPPLLISRLRTPIRAV